MTTTELIAYINPSRTRFREQMEDKHKVLRLVTLVASQFDRAVDQSKWTRGIGLDYHGGDSPHSPPCISINPEGELICISVWLKATFDSEARNSYDEFTVGGLAYFTPAELTGFFEACDASGLSDYLYQLTQNHPTTVANSINKLPMPPQ